MTISSVASGASPFAQTGDGPSSQAATNSQYDSAVGTFTALLSAQGEAVGNPLLALSLRAPPSSEITRATATVPAPLRDLVGPTPPLPSGAFLANEIVGSLGNGSDLTLAQAEQAMATPAGTGQNSAASITADFAALSGGSDVLSAGQLATAIQEFRDAGGFTGPADGLGGIFAAGVSVGPTTPGRS